MNKVLKLLVIVSIPVAFWKMRKDKTSKRKEDKVNNEDTFLFI